MPSKEELSLSWGLQSYGEKQSILGSFQSDEGGIIPVLGLPSPRWEALYPANVCMDRQTSDIKISLQKPGKSEDSSGTRDVGFVKAQDSLSQDSLAQADGGRQG